MDEMQWIAEITPEQLPEPYQTMAYQIGIHNTIRLAKQWAGTGMYFPQLDSVIAKLRNARICKEFDGSNHKALAHKYGLTERWIYQILQESSRAIDKDQLGLFDDLNQN